MMPGNTEIWRTAGVIDLRRRATGRGTFRVIPATVSPGELMLNYTRTDRGSVLAGPAPSAILNLSIRDVCCRPLECGSEEVEQSNCGRHSPPRVL